MKKNFRVSLPLLTLWVAAVLGGCSSPKTVDENGISKLSSTDTGVAINFQLKSEDPLIVDGGCQILLRKDNGLSDYPIPIHSGSGIVFAPLEEGSYKIHELYCGRRNFWELQWKPWPSFKVTAGKISVIAPLTFGISDAKNLASDFAGRPASQAGLLTIFGRLSAESQARVISGYTGTPITLDMLNQNPPSNRGWGTGWEVVEAKSGKKAEIKEHKWPVFKSCYNGENQINYLWVGGVHIEASFQDQKLLSADVKNENNTLSPQFSECAKTVLKEFKPGAPGELKYTVNL